MPILDAQSYRCVGVFDTVGSLGLPEELTLSSPKMKTLFGFNDRHLGEHIQFAFQALALDEHRKDFVSLHTFSLSECLGLFGTRRTVQSSNRQKVGGAKVRC